MISKETLHRFLVALDEQYGSVGEYFEAKPFNDIQKKLKRLRELLDLHSLCVFYNDRSCYKNATFYDVTEFFDMTLQISNAKSLEHIKVCVLNHETDESLTPDSPLFMEIAELYVTTHDVEHIFYTDVVEIDDMSFTIFDILNAIDEHAELHRLKRYMVVDRYVRYKSNDLDISSSPRFSEEFCDEAEALAEEVIPYWRGGKPSDMIAHDKSFYSWDDIFTKKAGDLSKENIIFLCQNLPPQNINDDTTALVNLVDFMIEKDSKFMCMLFVRSLTINGVNISYNKAPKFENIVRELSPFLSALRPLL